MNSMLLNSVVLVLQETLEAALLVSVLLAISYQQWRRISWLPFGLGWGIVISFLYASQMVKISEWFDYVGQEIVNAALQISITLLIGICIWALCSGRRINSQGKAQNKDHRAPLFTLCAATAVALAVTREGAEISLYLSGFFQNREYFQAVMVGSSIGFGIGVSLGVLLFYGLMSISGKWRLRTPAILLALFAGNMLSQAALQLTQADWISSSGALWDTSGWLSEKSITGQLLYALVGYESTPSAIQLIAYISGAALVIFFGVLGKGFSGLDRGNKRINAPVSDHHDS